MMMPQVDLDIDQVYMLHMMIFQIEIELNQLDKVNMWFDEWCW